MLRLILPTQIDIFRNSIRVLRWSAYLVIASLLTSCQHSSSDLTPFISYTPTVNWSESLPSPFPPLSSQEYQQQWGKELVIACQFASELDLYRAITSYKRALFLIPEKMRERRLQIHYGIIQCYYLGKKYQEAIDSFEKSPLIESSQNFAPLEDLILLLQDSYANTNQLDKASQLIKNLEQLNKEKARRLQLSTAIQNADFQGISIFSNNEQESSFLITYQTQALSIEKARMLNAILPGAGYFYVGQKQTAATSFMINTLFIAAAYHFFNNGNIAAGLLTSSLEAGWYFGGINGAGIAAKTYNENLYQITASNTLFQEKLFPVLMWNYSF